MDYVSMISWYHSNSLLVFCARPLAAFLINSHIQYSNTNNNQPTSPMPSPASAVSLSSSASTDRAVKNGRPKKSRQKKKKRGKYKTTKFGEGDGKKVTKTPPLERVVVFYRHNMAMSCVDMLTYAGFQCRGFR